MSLIVVKEKLSKTNVGISMLDMPEGSIGILVDGSFENKDRTFVYRPEATDDTPFVVLDLSDGRLFNKNTAKDWRVILLEDTDCVIISFSNTDISF